MIVQAQERGRDAADGGGVHGLLVHVHAHGVPVRPSVDGDKINCPCHNSQFSVADGSVLRGPATEALKPPKGVTGREGDQLSIG